MIRGTQAALLFRLDMGATGRGPCVRPGIGISTITTTNTRSRSGFSYTTASRADARENVKPRFQCGSSAIGLPRCSPVASRCQPECPVSDVGALALKRALGGHPVRVAALTSARAVDLRCTNPASRPRRIMSAAVLAARVMQWPASDARLGPTPMSKGPPIAGWRRDRRRGNGRDANGRAHWKDQHDECVFREYESRDTRSWGGVLIMGIPNCNGPTRQLNGRGCELAFSTHPECPAGPCVCARPHSYFACARQQRQAQVCQPTDQARGAVYTCSSYNQMLKKAPVVCVPKSIFSSRHNGLIQKHPEATR